MLAKAINPSMFWCAGSWNLRASQLPTIREVQRKMVRKMLRFKKAEEENIEDFMHRTNRTITNLMTNHRVKLFDALSHRAVFRWAGYLARTSFLFPSRWTTIVFKHKDWAWIQVVARENHGSQLHGRHLKTWRWERPLYRYFGEGWQTTQAESYWGETRVAVKQKQKCPERT